MSWTSTPGRHPVAKLYDRLDFSGAFSFQLRISRNALLLSCCILLDFAYDLLGGMEVEDNDSESNFHLLGSAATVFF